MRALGQPCRDPIILGDDIHRMMMENGSAALRHAIEDFYVARAKNRPHRPTSPNLMWLSPYSTGGNVREAANDTAPAPSDRDPCVKCGVRLDHHETTGCKTYDRGRV